MNNVGSFHVYSKNNSVQPTRRSFHRQIAAALMSGAFVSGMKPQSSKAAPIAVDNNCKTSGDEWSPKYILASSMYGYKKLPFILPEVAKIGAKAIDIWPKVHGDQREQITEMGAKKFKSLLADHKVSLGCVTQYPLGPFGLKDEIQFASQFGCSTIVTAAHGPKGEKGTALKRSVKSFVEKMKPHVEWAAKHDVSIAIENHANSLIESPDSMKYLCEFRTEEHLGIAFAPYHLPQEEKLIAELIEDTGDAIKMFYAWQHGEGCMKKMAKEKELLQMPGRGKLDFEPVVEALKNIEYSGWTEIFMHPFPRGIPILESVDDVTDEINRARNYLAQTINANTDKQIWSSQ